MDMKNFLKISCIGILAIFAASSCREVKGVDVMPADGVFAEISAPVSGDALTKSIEQDFTFRFSEEDRMTVIPQSGDEYLSYKLTPSKGKANRAFFLVQNFSMTNGTYYAVYPAQNVSNPESISLPFTGQAQSANKSSEHLAAYDYCTASAEITNNTGYFPFAHKVAWIMVSLNPGETSRTYSSLTLSADGGVATSMTLDATTGSFTLQKNASSTLALSLGSGLTISANDTLIAYMAVPADTYTNLVLKSTETNGHTYSYKFGGDNEFKTGHYYMIDLNDVKVTPLVDVKEYGLYKCYGEGEVYSWEKPLIQFEDFADQMSWYKSSSKTIFEFFQLGTDKYASFQIASGTISQGSTYKVSIYTTNGTECESANFKVIKKTVNTAWLYDTADELGCVIRIDE